jgi:anti-sigma B factor antagonist
LCGESKRRNLRRAQKVRVGFTKQCWHVYFKKNDEDLKRRHMDMTIEIKRTAEVTTIEIVGRLDTTTAPELDKTINGDIADVKNLVLNFKGLEYISSAGLRVLLSAQKKMQKIGSMKLINVCEEVMEVFEMTGFSDILTIE